MSLNRAALLAEVGTDLPDNGTENITPAAVRSLLTDILNNIWTLSDAQTFTGTLAIPSGSSWNLSGILQGNGGSAVSSLTLGQIPGTATNDAASAGNIGEFSLTDGTATSLSTGVAANLASHSFSAGDWDIWGIVNFNPAGTTTVSSIFCGTNGTSATLPIFPNGGLQVMQATLTTGVGQVLGTGMERYSLAGATTIYLVAAANFGVSTMTATGRLYGRRAR